MKSILEFTYVLCLASLDAVHLWSGCSADTPPSTVDDCPRGAAEKKYGFEVYEPVLKLERHLEVEFEARLESGRA